jgi:hypothetical protein
MNPQNPYGVIQGMGQAGQTPQYSAIGTFNTNQQTWTYPSGLLGNFTNACYSQGGYGEGHQGYHGYPSAPHPPYQNPDPNVRPDPYWDNSGTPFVFWRGPRQTLKAWMSSEQWTREEDGMALKHERSFA